MTSKSEMALLNCVSGHPLALQRLRQMQAVVEAARDVVMANRAPGCEENTRLQKALAIGGWIKSRVMMSGKYLTERNLI